VSAVAEAQLAQVFPRDAWDRWGKPRSQLHLVPPLTRLDVAPESRDRSYLWLYAPEGNVIFFPTESAPGLLPGTAAPVATLEFGFPDQGLASTLGWTAFNSDGVGSFFAITIECFKVPSVACVCQERDEEFKHLQRLFAGLRTRNGV